MNTVLLFLLTSLGRTVSAQIKCVSEAIFFEDQRVENAPMIIWNGSCSLYLGTTAIPCNTTTFSFVASSTELNSPGCVKESTLIACYCNDNLCNQNPEVIYRMLTKEDWTGDPNSQELAQCGLEVLREKFGYPPTSTTTTRRIEDEETTGIEDEETTPDDDTPYKGPNNENGQPPAEETKCLPPTGRTESSVLYIVGGVLGAVLVLLVLVVTWFVLTYRQVTNTLKYEENQVKAVRADNDKWRRELIKFKRMEEDLEKQPDKATMSNISEIRDVKPATVAQNTKNR